jgi:uncharacterized membrane protein YccC
VLRHAVRLALLVGACDLVVRLTDTTRGYWIPMAILVILRPDFATTWQRSYLRVIGTILGLLLATELVHWVPGGHWWRIALIGIFFFAMRLAGPGNVGLSALAVAALIVVLLSLAGVPPHTTLLYRSVDTLIGGALAIVAALFAPVWERERVPERLAELLAAYRSYLEVIIDPVASSGRLQRARAAARLARSNAQGSVDRARTDPVDAQRAVELGDAVLAHTHRFVHGMLTVDAVRKVLPGLPEGVEFFRAAEQVLRRCELSVLDGSAPRRHGLRPAQQQLAALLTAHPERAGGVAAAGALVTATDRVANSLDTLASELRRQFRPDRAGSAQAAR